MYHTNMHMQCTEDVSGDTLLILLHCDKGLDGS